MQLRTNPTTSLISWSLLCTAFHSLGDTWPQQVTPGCPDPFTPQHHDQTINLSTQRNVWRGAEVSKCKWTTEFRFPALIEQLLLWGTGEKHNPQAQRILTKPHLLCKVVCRKRREHIPVFLHFKLVPGPGSGWMETTSGCPATTKMFLLYSENKNPDRVDLALDKGREVHVLVLSPHNQVLLTQDTKDEGSPERGPPSHHAVTLTSGIAGTPDGCSIPGWRLFPNHRAKTLLIADFMGLCQERKTLLVKLPLHQGHGKGSGKRKYGSMVWEPGGLELHSQLCSCLVPH